MVEWISVTASIEDVKRRLAGAQQVRSLEDILSGIGSQVQGDIIDRLAELTRELILDRDEWKEKHHAMRDQAVTSQAVAAAFRRERDEWRAEVERLRVCAAELAKNFDERDDHWTAAAHGHDSAYASGLSEAYRYATEQVVDAFALGSQC